MGRELTVTSAVEGVPASVGASSSRRSVAVQVALTLALSPNDWTSRRDLRAILPEGRTRPRLNGQGWQNDVSTRLRDVLRDFERAGWLRRDDVAVLVLDRGALYDFAQQA